MSYFVSREELLFEIAKAVDAVFSAVSRLFSEKDEELSRKLKELRNEFLLLINTVGQQSYQSKNNHGLAPVVRNRRKKMSERKFEEILEDVVNHVMDSDDEELIILVDELEGSAKEFREEKEQIKFQLKRIYKKTEEFLKKEGIEKVEKKEEKASD